MKRIKTYSELCSLKTYEERLKYVMEYGNVGSETFGNLRHINQQFYKTEAWQRARRKVIERDNGCDLGIPDLEIMGFIYVHHLNPITLDDILYSTPYALDPNYLICTSLTTHNALHYSKKITVPIYPLERFPNDMCPWKR